MPVSVAELISRGLVRLKTAGIDDAEISSRLILQYILNKTSSDLQLSSDEIIADEKIKQYDRLLEKRCLHVPVQYLIGEVEFYNVKLKVDERALIPRPETEVLVENLVELIKPMKSPRLLDIGTGSGNIAIAIAANVEDVSVTTVDVSADSLDLARANASLNYVNGKIEFVCADCLQSRFWRDCGKFDAIVSNPPYVDNSDYNDLQPEVRYYEPKVALVARGDQFTFFKSISRRATTALNPKGIICFEVGFGQADKVVSIIHSCLPNSEINIIDDLAGIQRVVVGVKR
ncbi:MAG: peptide chain release factor N(5)-glutamine methyltransferase [candidate division Zixibacteria bacterium]|nr:peptide chain release factor N(5)-glutamine methyltransferase [candidate division Zixibacteria bacterium]